MDMGSSRAIQDALLRKRRKKTLEEKNLEEAKQNSVHPHGPEGTPFLLGFFAFLRRHSLTKRQANLYCFPCSSRRAVTPWRIIRTADVFTKTLSSAPPSDGCSTQKVEDLASPPISRHGHSANTRVDSLSGFCESFRWELTP